ncbi:hypothetical protein MPNT_320003 [Candidatus Methylacidithermus pantelleriae]|uniref:Uncharacterized protein n=1 Tax=Candidatus Methylacidithermus pantelleriae TaxID=2744239 RepID=A0A8J2FWL2_9BACT|nr:hypothetical protein MPNT_320003 [Candidatus Methylacidithermus pantelleriae]
MDDPCFRSAIVLRRDGQMPPFSMYRAIFLQCYFPSPRDFAMGIDDHTGYSVTSYH